MAKNEEVQHYQGVAVPIANHLGILHVFAQRVYIASNHPRPDQSP